MRYAFGDFLLDTDTGELLRDGQSIPLRRQAFRLLQALVERAPALVERDALLDAVWGHDALSPNVLPQTISELRQALGDSAQAPLYIETRHRRGYRLITTVRLEAGTPAPPPSTGSEAAPRAPLAAAKAPVPPPHGRVSKRTLVLVALMLVAALAAVLPVWHAAPTRPQAADAPPPSTLAVGVFPADPDIPAWLPAAALELLSQRLAGTRDLRLLRSDVLGLVAAPADAGWQHRMHSVLGAPLALTGHWQAHGTDVRLDLSLIDLANGRLLLSRHFTGQTQDLDRLVDAAARATLAALERPWPAESPRPDAGTRTRYWSALAALAVGEAGDAADALQALHAASSQPAWLEPSLLRALREAGRFDAALALLEARLARNDPAPLGERLRMDVEQAQLQHRPDRAAAALRALSDLFPHDPDIGLALAAAELDALQGDAARRTLTRWAAQTSIRHDPRARLLRARLARIDHDLDTALSEAGAVMDAAVLHGLPQLAADAALSLATSHRARGDLAAADMLLAQVDARWHARLTPPRRLDLQIARLSLLREQGLLADARALLDGLPALPADPVRATRLQIEAALLDAAQAAPDVANARLDGVRSIALSPHQPALGVHWHNAHAIVALAHDDLDTARDAFDAAFALARRSGQSDRALPLQVNAGLLLARQRRFDEADALWTQALESFERLGDQRGQATCLGNLAAAAAARGRSAQATELNTRALALYRALRLPGHRARIAFNLALVHARAGRMAEADALFREAGDAWRSEGATEHVLQVAAVHAEHQLRRGDAEGAEATLDAVEPLAASGSPLRRAHLAASRALLLQQRHAFEAARALQREAHALRRTAGAPAWAALSELALLQLDLLDGAPGLRVAVAAESLAARFADLGEHRDAARAWLLVGEARISAGQRDDAKAALTAARDAASLFEDVTVQLDLDWLATWLAPPDERTERLAALQQRAASLGLDALARHAAVAQAQGGQPASSPAPAAHLRLLW